MSSLEEKKCPLCGLFDCGFKHFITPKIIRLVYVLAIIGLAIVSICMIVKAFSISQAHGILTLIILAPLYFIITVILTRIWLELIMIIFRIADDVGKLAGREPCEKKEETPPPPEGTGCGQSPM